MKHRDLRGDSGFGMNWGQTQRDREQEAKQVCNTTDLDALLIQRIDDLIRLERDPSMI